MRVKDILLLSKRLSRKTEKSAKFPTPTQIYIA